LVATEEATKAGLDPSVLQGVAEPGDLDDALLDDLGPVADHVSGCLDLGPGDEAARRPHSSVCAGRSASA
jgi:hypothetical protein